MTYDPSTPTGIVRLLAVDTSDDPIFVDAEIEALLTINGQDVRLAAAQALDIIAASNAMTLKVITLLDLMTNGAQTAAALKAQAAELREQALMGIGDPSGNFDIAEMVYDSFTARARMIELAKRELA